MRVGKVVHNQRVVRKNGRRFSRTKIYPGSPSPGAALSHSTASRPSAAAKARAPAIVIFVLFAMLRSLPFDSVATGASRALPLGNTQDTPGNGAGFEGGKGRKCRAQTPRGLQAVVTTGLSALRGCAEEVRLSTPFGVWFSYPRTRPDRGPARVPAARGIRLDSVA